MHSSPFPTYSSLTFQLDSSYIWPMLPYMRLLYLPIGMVSRKVLLQVSFTFISICTKLIVHQVPWSTSPNGYLGPLFMHILYDVWMNLCARNPRRPFTSAAILVYNHTPAALACHALKKSLHWQMITGLLQISYLRNSIWFFTKQSGLSSQFLYPGGF